MHEQIEAGEQLLQRLFAQFVQQRDIHSFTSFGAVVESPIREVDIVRAIIRTVRWPFYA